MRQAVTVNHECAKSSAWIKQETWFLRSAQNSNAREQPPLAVLLRAWLIVERWAQPLMHRVPSEKYSPAREAY